MCSQANGEVLQEFVWYVQAVGTQCGHCLVEIHRIPVHDSSDDETQPAGAQPLIIERAIVDHAAAVKAHRTTERVLCLTLVQADRDAAAELRALQPFELE
jgi:hypothetical protein